MKKASEVLQVDLQKVHVNSNSYLLYVIRGEPLIKLKAKSPRGAAAIRQSVSTKDGWLVQDQWGFRRVPLQPSQAYLNKLFTHIRPCVIIVVFDVSKLGEGRDGGNFVDEFFESRARTVEYGEAGRWPRIGRTDGVALNLPEQFFLPREDERTNLRQGCLDVSTSSSLSAGLQRDNGIDTHAAPPESML